MITYLKAAGIRAKLRPVERAAFFKHSAGLGALDVRPPTGERRIPENGETGEPRSNVLQELDGHFGGLWAYVGTPGL